MRAVVLAILMVSGVAHAEPSVGIIVMGEPTLQTPLASHLKAWLSEHEHPVVERPFDREDHARTFVDCFVIEDIKCATASFANARSEHLVFARVDLVAGEAREATVTGYWFAKNHDPVAEKRACKGCDDAALHATVRSLLDALARASAIGKGRLILKSKPPGLVAVIDNIKLGVTPIERDLAPGNHRVAILDGARTVAISDVTIVRGGIVELTLPEPSVARAGGLGRLGPALLVGGGAATVIGGGAFLYHGGKGGTDEPYEYPGATKAGAIMTIAGAAAVAGGALWWRAMGKRERSRLVAPALVAVGVAAIVGGAIALSYGAKRGPDEPFVYDNATAIGAPLAIAGGGAVISAAITWLFDDSRSER